MKIFNLLTVVASVYAQGYGSGGNNQALMGKLQKAVEKCMVYMEKALTCDPPQSKIPKYTHRLSAVFLDSVHHLNIGKCEPKAPVYYRKRREDDDNDEEFNALVQQTDEFTGKGKKVTEQQLNKFSKICNVSAEGVLNSKELADCKKLGAWKNRMAHLLNDIEIMRNVCKQQANTGYGNPY